MKNLGPKSREWLASIGVRSLDDVARLGVVETYKRVIAAHPEKVTLEPALGTKEGLPRNAIIIDATAPLPSVVGTILENAS